MIDLDSILSNLKKEFPWILGNKTDLGDELVCFLNNPNLVVVVSQKEVASILKLMKFPLREEEELVLLGTLYLNSGKIVEHSGGYSDILKKIKESLLSQSVLFLLETKE